MTQDNLKQESQEETEPGAGGNISGSSLFEALKQEIERLKKTVETLQDENKRKDSEINKYLTKYNMEFADRCFTQARVDKLIDTNIPLQEKLNNAEMLLAQQERRYVDFERMHDSSVREDERKLKNIEIKKLQELAQQRENSDRCTIDKLELKTYYQGKKIEQFQTLIVKQEEQIKQLKKLVGTQTEEISTLRQQSEVKGIPVLKKQ